MIAATVSLRFRLILGAGLIAAVALIAVFLAAYGAAETVLRIEQSVAAQRRIDTLSILSARVSDYAVVAVEASAPDAAWEPGLARLKSRAAHVDDAFARMGQGLAGAVADSQGAGEAEQMRRATRSLVLARMRAQFDALRRAVEGDDRPPNLRVALDGFATQFSPLLTEAIAEERRDREAAAESVAAMRGSMIVLTVASVCLVAALMIAFHGFLIRPLVTRLERASEAAADIGQGDFDVDLPVKGRDEIARLFKAINATAKRLKQRREDVDHDRARLNETIAQRTAALSEANDRLSQIDAERRRFFADVGHELRTPLTVILAESELAMKEGGGPDESAKAMSVIRSRAQRLNRRINDLLRVARSETGQVELESRPFDLADAAECAVSDIATMAERQNVTVVRNLRPAPTRGDADWCRQVVSGLIDNALRHSPKGGVIEIATAVDGGDAVLTVTDEGEGLNPDDCERVFDRFSKGERQAGTSGSGFGVGLSLARWVIEHHEGTVKLNSPAPRPPQGATSARPGAQVVIRLPKSDAAENNADTLQRAVHG